MDEVLGLMLPVSTSVIRHMLLLCLFPCAAATGSRRRGGWKQERRDGRMRRDGGTEDAGICRDGGMEGCVGMKDGRMRRSGGMHR